MEQLVELLRESVIVQGLITLMVLGTYCYIVIIGHVVPDGLEQIAGVIIGFFFGAKMMRPMAEQRVRDLMRKERNCDDKP